MEEDREESVVEGEKEKEKLEKRKRPGIGMLKGVVASATRRKGGGA